MNTYKPLTEERKLAIAEFIAANGSDAFWDRVHGKGSDKPNQWDIEDDFEENGTVIFTTEDGNLMTWEDTEEIDEFHNGIRWHKW